MFTLVHVFKHLRLWPHCLCACGEAPHGGGLWPRKLSLMAAEDKNLDVRVPMSSLRSHLLKIPPPPHSATGCVPIPQDRSCRGKVFKAPTITVLTILIIGWFGSWGELFNFFFLFS